MPDEKTVTPDETKDGTKWEAKPKWVKMIDDDDSISDKEAFAEVFLDMYLTAYNKCFSIAFEKTAKDGEIRSIPVDTPKGELSDEDIAKLTRSKFNEYFQKEISEYTGTELNLHKKSDFEAVQFAEALSKVIFDNSKKEYRKALKQKEQEKIDKRLEANPDDPLDDLGDGYAKLNSHIVNEILSPIDIVTKQAIFTGEPLPAEPIKRRLYPLSKKTNVKGKIKWVQDESKPLDVTVRRDYGTLPIPLDATGVNIYSAICSLFNGKDDDTIVVATVALLDEIARHGSESTEISAQELTEWIDILNHQRFSLDSIQLEEILTAVGIPEENRKAYKKYFSSEKPLLEAYRIYSLVPGGNNTRKNSKTVVDAYEIRKPALLTYAQLQNQISRSPMAELQTKTPTKTGGYKRLKGDLLKSGAELFISNSVNDMKARHRTRRILFDTMYSECSVTDGKTKAKLRDYCFAYLEYQKGISERITGFKVVLLDQKGNKSTHNYKDILNGKVSTKGKVYYAVDIELNENWLKDTSK